MANDLPPLRPFTIHADIRRAETLPAAVYHDARWFEIQKQRVFGRAWHLLPDAARVKAPGHVLPFTLLEHVLDEPLLLARDEDGQLRCFSNVCTHRGALVVEGEAHSRSLRCRYHGRKFDLCGRFLAMPEFDDVEGFPSPRDDLPPAQLAGWGPWTFAAIDPAFAFDDWIAPLRRRVEFLPLERARLDTAGVQEFTIHANWALYCDNYLEEFHIPYVHASSLAGLDYGEYRTETYEWCNLQLGVQKSADGAFDLPADHPDAGQHIGGFYYWLFPNLMLNFYPWGCSVNIVEPLGPTRTRVRFLPYVWDEGKRGAGVGSDLYRVEMEDEEIVEAVQRGVRSRLYDRGRYSPRREIGTHHFHTLLARFLEA
jgi:choline monooxygenase